MPTTIGWAARCPECQGRWAIERHVTVRESRLPERAESQRTRWSVECEAGHAFKVDAAREREYKVVAAL